MENEKLYAVRHSLAHIMASAVQRIYGVGAVKFGVGPVVENGFYYDIDLGDKKVSIDDFAKIEKEIRKIIAEKQDFVRSEKGIDDAIAWAKAAGQPYKLELLNDLKREGTTVAKNLDADELGLATDGDAKIENVSFYTNGDFTDLCRGPHVANSGEIAPDAFKLMRVAGAYWRGSEKNPMMTRVYGVAFESKPKLDEYLNMLEEAEKRDHRKLGKELDLFVFSDLIGAGLPLFTPRGTVLRRQLDNFVQSLRDEYGYQEVNIPHITKKDAYVASGHWKKFKDELFRIKTREGHEFAMKPMNCPHHTQIYASQVRSYRDLPIRYRETTTCYRDEQSGELSGLSRVRSLTQDDAHVFCRVSQVEREILNVWDIINRFYKTVGFGELKVRFSTHDPANMDAYSGTEEKWLSTEKQLLNVITKKVGDNYMDGVGEAAFYGPKIDFIARDAIGRTWQVATIQLDFNQPEGFDLTCIDENGERERIVMIHCAIMGSIERFLSIYIEHTAGKFPIWCAPEQLRVILVNDSENAVKLATKVMNFAKENGVRATLDDSNNSVGKKIRSAEIMKVPYSIVIGDKEAESSLLPLRVRSDLDANADVEHVYEPEKLIESIANEARGRVGKSSL
ncbi:threonine--tRNA ligase [Candidatus Saccharibacteria bacterium]|nr:threonine--tRNA ligase [Candidatus Saccharibacteria bacterium]MCL1963101.1 threonine--tRNA ligase [Candidatus Saccharibacteria bacterium]